MHTTTINDTNFLHNGAYDGNVIINTESGQMEIAFEDLKAFIVSYVRTEKVNRLECKVDNQTDDEVLGLNV